MATRRALAVGPRAFEFFLKGKKVTITPDEAAARVAYRGTVTRSAVADYRHLPKLFGRIPRGGKEVYLPQHVITFIRPKPHHPPTMATFKVPLTFTKLDLRDYLWHVYAVRADKVRAYVASKALERKGYGGLGRWHRPTADKFMIALLRDPFVWPDPPAEDERGPWDKELFERVQQSQKLITDHRQDASKGIIPLKSDEPLPPHREELQRLAGEYLSGAKEWTNNAKLDEIWEERERE